jgi:hypothetical protein
MTRLYIAFIGGFIALLIYAGTTGNFGIIPRLSFDPPFVGQAAPPSQTLLAPMLLPDRSGPIGVTAGQFYQHMERNGAKVSWERGATHGTWVLRYAMRNELTNSDFSGAGRLVVLSDATSAGVHGTATVFDAWAEDGQDFTLAETYSTVLSIATAIRQGRR